MPFTPASNRYDSMVYRRCGRSGLLLPAVSLGLWNNFGTFHSYENARSLVQTAFNLGITHFDLANNYGPPPGSAEATFGRILAQDLGTWRDELVISTKAGYDMWPGPYGNFGSRKYMLASLDQSLRRMELDYVDIFYSHRMDPDTPLAETMGALDTAVRSGRALYAGISNYDAQRTREAARILRELGTPCLIHQPPYNMLRRDYETGGAFDAMAAEGIGCIAFSPLSQGMLTSKYLDGIPNDSRAADPHSTLAPERITNKTVAVLRDLNALAAGRGQSLAQMALAWVLRQPVVCSVLTGASRPDQLHQNVAALQNLDFTSDELEAIDRVLATPA